MTLGSDIVSSANGWVTAKVPYVWGGASKFGADCSGFVQQVLSGLGIPVGRTVADQASAGTAVPLGPSGDQLANAKPGDILIFGNNAHEGIYTGGGQMIHEPHTGTVASMSTVWTGGTEPLTGIRRVTSSPVASQLAWNPITGFGNDIAKGGVDAANSITSGATSDVANALWHTITDPIASLAGGSLQAAVVRGGLIVFGALLVLVALGGITAPADNVAGVAVHGAGNVGSATARGARRTATTAAVIT